MRTIDMETWSRRAHFEYFNAYDHPHFGITANVDLSAFYPVIKQRGISLTTAMVYVVTRASNAIAEFRYRVRDGKVIEHEIVHPSFTILVDEDIFSFCTVDYADDFAEFAVIAAKGIQDVKDQLELEDDPGRDDLLYMTALPWLSFTSYRAPMASHPGDSIPRFAWGKFFQDGDTLMMPLCVEVHHALIDGEPLG